MTDDDECGAEELTEETEVFGENPPQFHFVHHKFHIT
jgi:hypothetical protein